ncbi:putative transcription factor bZIP family [Helianthus annuus]|nr:putative transcription factor bZIP family [Helianthus annuus]
MHPHGTTSAISLIMPTSFQVIYLFQFYPTTNQTKPNQNSFIMDPMEFEAAEALAGLARLPASNSVSRGSESVLNDRNSCSGDSYPEVATSFMVKKSNKSGVSTAKSVKDEHSTDLRLNPAHPTNCAPSGRKSRQNLTEAEVEARKIRRVLANRESARQTIRRRQAVFEELTRKAADLSWDNENLKREKDTASKRLGSLKAKNECLKAQMKMMYNEAKENQEESITTNEPSMSASSANSPSLNYIQPSFLPFVWPNSVQLPPAGIVIPSHIPVTPAIVNKPDLSSCEGSSGRGTPLYLLPYPWLFTLPQSGGNENRANSFNLNDKPRESCECQQFFPEKTSETPANGGFPPDGGGRATTNLVVEQIHKIHKVPVVCSGERSLGDIAAAAEARRKRKQLTRLKNHLHFRQLRTH